MAKPRENKITPEKVADALGIPVQTLRVALQYEAYPFGKAYKMPGATKYSYLFSPGAVREYLGDELYNKMMGC